jgi:hypothetical protein
VIDQVEEATTTPIIPSLTDAPHHHRDESSKQMAQTEVENFFENVRATLDLFLYMLLQLKCGLRRQDNTPD